MKKENKSLFALQIEANPEAHCLAIVLGMVGISTTIEGAELILTAQEAVANMGGNFDLKTAAKIKCEVDKKYTKIRNDFKNQEATKKTK